MSQFTSAFNTSIFPTIPTQFPTDAGTAIPAANTLNIFSGISTGNTVDNLRTTGVGNTVTVFLNNSINQPNTNASGTEGMYSLGGDRFLHNYGTGNTFLGEEAGNLTLTTANAIGNTVIGYRAGQALVGTAPNDADGNVIVGLQAGQSLTDGSRNTFLGSGSGNLLLTGDDNFFGGFDSGSALTGAESGNILINHVGVIGESAAIRIGTSQTTNYQAGIYNVTPAGATEYVIIDSAGQLGSAPIGMLGWIFVAGTTQTIAINTQYAADNAGTVTFTLPATATQGDEFWVVGGNSNAASRWTIAQNANQSIRIGSSTTTVGVGGSITSTSASDGIRCLCTVTGASTVWKAITSMGTLAIV